jgi:hypothetical protein
MSIFGTALFVGASAASSAITLGTYGHLRNKRWSTWKAGAGAGAVAAGAALGMLALQKALGGSVSGVFMKKLSGLVVQPVKGLTVQQLKGLSMQPIQGLGATPMVFAGSPAFQVAGCRTCR